MSVHGDEALRLFHCGYNCAQSVAGAFAEELGLPLETVARMVSGFGGGFGRLREVCGCVSGMTFVYSALRGYGVPGNIEVKTDVYAGVQALAEEFRRLHGSIVCRELLGLKEAEGTPRPRARTPEYYKKRPCAELARCAADLLDEYLSKEESSCSLKAP